MLSQVEFVPTDDRVYSVKMAVRVASTTKHASVVLQGRVSEQASTRAGVVEFPKLNLISCLAPRAEKGEFHALAVLCAALPILQSVRHAGSCSRLPYFCCRYDNGLRLKWMGQRCRFDYSFNRIVIPNPSYWSQVPRKHATVCFAAARVR